MSITKQRAIRTLAFQGLFQLDALGDTDRAELRSTLETMAQESKIELSAKDVDKALEIARGAYGCRREADAMVAELAPTWPAPRQPAADRALIRLAHYEMFEGLVNPKIAVNEAIELAKLFSTEKSPSFVNGVLDKVLKRVLAEREAKAAAAQTPTATEEAGEP